MICGHLKQGKKSFISLILILNGMSVNSFAFDGEANNNWYQSFSGNTSVGLASYDFPRNHIFSLNHEDVDAPYSETRLNGEFASDRVSFSFDLYGRTFFDSHPTIENRVDSAIVEGYLTYLGDDYEVNAGRINENRGIAKSFLIADFFSENTIASIYSLGGFEEKRKRVGQVSIGLNKYILDSALFSLYFVPKINSIDENFNNLNVSNKNNNRIWASFSKNFGNSINADAILQLEEDNNRAAIVLNGSPNDKTIIYTEALWREHGALPQISIDTDIIDTSLNASDLNIVVGFEYSLNAKFSFTSELFWQKRGYNSSEVDSLYRIVENPQNPSFTNAVTSFPIIPLRQWQWYSELRWNAENYEATPNLLLSPDGSGRVAAVTKWLPFSQQNISLNLSLSQNFGGKSSEFGALGQSRQIGLYAMVNF